MSRHSLFSRLGGLATAVVILLLVWNHYLVLHNLPDANERGIRKQCPLQPAFCPKLGCGKATRNHLEVVSKPEARHPAPPKGKNLILGMATQNIELARLGVFLRSAREFVSPRTLIVILSDQPSAPNSTRAQLLDALGVQETVSWVSGELESQYHPNSHRWVLLRDFLKGQKVQYDAVLFTDVRDVAFQGDPFAIMTGQNKSSLFVFREASPARRGEDGTIATEQRNKGWVLKCFGQEGLDEIGREVVSCAGVTMSGWSAALVYVSLMVDTILSKSTCIDQGVHNYLIYSGKLQRSISPAPLVVVPLEQGVVAQVQSMPPQSVWRNKIGQIVTPTGIPYAIVHQYDRSKHRYQPQALQQFQLFPSGSVLP
uniref:Nucleotide-diphospho-sugar transferase domain-containing protein n=1 Tax=Hemiselmis andersenii TaxID=464988 RepID=A0A6T8PIA8_HEMAN|mmetsp:Transcript_38045/g.88831  ORF Transcript_38045/g.88831 Transcript_38045/m.88831 type:complete len:370 (-) Transcript_38045:559-1668(-)